MKLASARDRMVQRQLVARGIRDDRVLGAMREVPRHRFVPSSMAGRAYADEALPIGKGQTISQPYAVALMLEAARIVAGAKVLEIGTGTGYQAAVLDRLGASVYSIEARRDLAGAARQRLRELGFARIRVRHGDGSDGWPEAAPFDAIIVTAAAAEIPRAPLGQLRPGGRMVVPVGDPPLQELVVLRPGPGGLRVRFLGPCRFTGLVGRHGWKR